MECQHCARHEHPKLRHQHTRGRQMTRHIVRVLCLESLIMDSLSIASSADAAGWSSKHIPALAILRRAGSRQPPVASDTRCEPPCASRDNNLSAPATGANGDCDEAAASKWMKCWRNRETSCAVGDRPMRDVKTS